MVSWVTGKQSKSFLCSWHFIFSFNCWMVPASLFFVGHVSYMRQTPVLQVIFQTLVFFGKLAINWINFLPLLHFTFMDSRFGRLCKTGPQGPVFFSPMGTSYFWTPGDTQKFLFIFMFGAQQKWTTWLMVLVLTRSVHLFLAASLVQFLHSLRGTGTSSRWWRAFM